MGYHWRGCIVFSVDVSEYIKPNQAKTGDVLFIKYIFENIILKMVFLISL